MTRQHLQKWNPKSIEIEKTPIFFRLITVLITKIFILDMEILCIFGQLVVIKMFFPSIKNSNQRLLLCRSFTLLFSIANCCHYFSSEQGHIKVK